MKILVCIKPVPDPDKYGDLRIDPETRRLVREGIPTVINPCDRNALEAALQLRDAHGGTVTVLSMAPGFSRDKMLESLAMGADEAYLLSDPAFGGADTLATSYVLAEGARRIAQEKSADGADAEAERSAADGMKAAAEACLNGTAAAAVESGFTGFDLILAGHESADGATSHVPTQLAEWLELPHICNVKELEVLTADAKAGGTFLQAVRRSEEGDLVFRCPLPAVIAVSRELNKPRLVNAMGIIKARKKPLVIWSNEELGLDPDQIGLAGSPTQPGELLSPEMRRAAESLGTDVEEAADRILEIAAKAGA